MLKNKLYLCAMCAVLFLTGCVSLKVGPEAEPSSLRMEGLASAYVSTGGIRQYDKTILQFELFSNLGRSGEIVSVDLWPFAGFGLGLVGVRAHVLPLEVGAGILFYPPKPAVPVEEKRIIEEKKVIIEDKSK
jgi:hypothetical protein